MKIGILKSWDSPKSGPLHSYYIEACKKMQIDYEVIDILAYDWVEKIRQSNCDIYVCRPPDKIQEQKSIYDEKIYFIHKFLKKIIYPTFDELYIYENKRNMANFLQIANLPHPETYIFARKNDAKEFLNNAEYPLVFKTNIGNAAKGVTIVKNKRKALQIVNKVFGRWHEYFTLGRLTWTTHKRIPIPMLWNIQKNYLIIQKFHNIKWEWRITKIGEILAGHQKLLDGDFASGTGLKGWVEPPRELLDLVRKLSENYKFHSIAVDIFETESGEYLINEIQSLYGAYLPYQMKINDVPGIFKYDKGNDTYIFISGDFHQNASYELRIKHAISILKDNK